ncbi:MAG: nucleotidyltransferase [Candidatus Aenigmarchaeota archaeon]|nr:nucleotidyltransferase [Candidatus Aenigmarchaeota archaeon]
MLADKEFLEKLLDYIGKKLKHEVRGLLIGGNAMMFYDLRGQTKDLDIVLYDKNDVTGIIQIIKNHPLFRKTEITKKLPYKIKPELKEGNPTVFSNGDMPRFDLFYKNVFSIDTEQMHQLAKRSIRFDLLTLKLVEPEHLIFLKAVTGRSVDREDIVRLTKNLDINWNLFLQFALDYYEKDEKAVWFVLDTLYDIYEKENLIPEFVIKKIGSKFDLKK